MKYILTGDETAADSHPRRLPNKIGFDALLENIAPLEERPSHPNSSTIPHVRADDKEDISNRGESDGTRRGVAPAAALMRY